MLLVGVLVGNLGVQLTLVQQRGADYAHHFTDCPPGFENLTASAVCIARFGIIISETNLINLPTHCVCFGEGEYTCRKGRNHMSHLNFQIG